MGRFRDHAIPTGRGDFAQVHRVLEGEPGGVAPMAPGFGSTGGPDLGDVRDGHLAQKRDRQLST